MMIGWAVVFIGTMLISHSSKNVIGTIIGFTIFLVGDRIVGV